MEIPYIVEPRKDTGLTNSKIAIWLFLASEVMLFGGLFSAYIFLRLGADYPWPERALPILPGLVNTAILILSSVTVVFAWAELKLRNWRKFQIYMGITLLCAATFMAIKLPGEYASKFAHQAIRMNDFATVEGHVLARKEYGDKIKHPDSLGNHFRVAPSKFLGYEVEVAKPAKGEKKKYTPYVNAFEVSVNVTRFHDKYFDHILSQVDTDKGWKTYLYLGSNKNAYIEIGGETFNHETPLSIDVLETFQDAFVEARTNNNNLNAALMRQAWSEFRKRREEGKLPAYVGKPDRMCVSAVNEIQKGLKAEAVAKGEYLNHPDSWKDDKDRLPVPNSLTFYIEPGDSTTDNTLVFVPAKGNFGGGTSLRSAAEGEILVNPELVESDKYKQPRIGILHRDKTNVIGEAVHLELLKDKDGKYIEHTDKKNKGFIKTREVGITRSGIEIAVDHIDMRHFIMRWQNDDPDRKPTLAMYLGEVVDGVYYDYKQVRERAREEARKEGKTAPIPVDDDGNEIVLSLFDEKNLAIDYYKDKEKKELAKRIKNGVTISSIWRDHSLWVYYRDKQLENKGGINELERFTVPWNHMVGYYNFREHKQRLGTDEPAFKSVEEFQEFQDDWLPGWAAAWMGPDHSNKEEVERAFPYLWVPRKEIRLESNLTPKWNNYYAIYFTITGLHGLHVIGGAIVLGYYLFFGRKMFDTNPEWLANRVEVGGLFWHFVDLVWIFAFPIFYLM